MSVEAGGKVEELGEKKGSLLKERLAVQPSTGGVDYQQNQEVWSDGRGHGELGKFGSRA